MRFRSSCLYGASLLVLMPFVAQAAGTYYTGSYQSPQQTYAQRTYSQAQTGYNNQYATTYSRPYVSSNRSAYTSSRYNQNASTSQQTKTTSSSSSKSGFYLDAGMSKEVANWKFEMKNSGSILHYDNIDWYVFDANAGYNFSLGSTPAEIYAGLTYGMQSGETTMVDDDISNGGYLVTTWIEGSTNEIIGDQIGHAMSIGTSQGGSMMGFNVGFGLTDFMKIGNMKITPSIGYRHFSYKLTTEKNYGLAVDTAACFRIEGSDEIQCDPAIIVNYSDGTQQIIWRDEATGEMQIGSGAVSINPGGTYSFEQPGTSHSYEVAWSGPYVALDMDYEINQNNNVNGRLEIGLPGYKSTGDQPYRIDWQHPKSVEDEAGMGSALHLGLGANWSTAITDSVMLSIGLTYDYYSVSDANAKTYLNSNYYTSIYNTILAQWIAAGRTEEEMLNPEGGDAVAQNIKALETSCPGWVCSADGEIESFYKSMGIRVGINAKF